MKTEFGEFKSAARLEPAWDVPTKPGQKQKTRLVTPRITVDRKNFPLIASKAMGGVCEVLVKIRNAGGILPHPSATDKDIPLEIDILEIAEPKGRGDLLEEMGYKGKR